MYLDPQRRRARRSRWFVPAAFVVLAGVWGLTVGETEGSGGKIGFHLDSGKWAVVTGWNDETETFTVEQNLDSAPSCS